MNNTLIPAFRRTRAPLALLMGLMLPAVAFAHPGHVAGNVFVQGFVHPFTGLDHMLAMLASGMWAAQLGGRARWQVPAVFVGMMVLGAMLGMQTGAVSLVETGVGASVIVLGLLVAIAARMPQLLGAVVVAIFAVLHGHAHGAELASADGAAIFIAGFALATALLHALAVGAVAVLQSLRQVVAVRAIGAVIAAVGAMLLAF